jgi:hypothetical protein
MSVWPGTSSSRQSALLRLCRGLRGASSIGSGGHPRAGGGGLFPSSLMDCYYVDIPLVLLLAWSLPGGGLPGPTSLAGASYGSSHPPCRPDPKGFNVAVSSLPSSLQVGLSHCGGYFSHPYGYGCRYKHLYNLVSPLHHGGASISSAARPDLGGDSRTHGGLPSGSTFCPSDGDVPCQHGGPYRPRGVPQVVYSAHGALGPHDGIPQVVFGPHGLPLHGFPHVPALVRTHQDFPGALVISLAHEDQRLLALDVTMSLLVAGRAAPPPFQQGAIPPVAPQSSPLA